jgi:hypothetical protein
MNWLQKHKLDYPTLILGITWIASMAAIVTYKGVTGENVSGRDVLFFIAFTLFASIPGLYFVYLGVGGYRRMQSTKPRALWLTPAELRHVRRAMTEAPEHHDDSDYREAYYKVEQADRHARHNRVQEPGPREKR